MLELCSVGALDIAQRRVCLHDATLNEVVETKEVLLMAKTVQVPATERQGTEVLVNGGEKVLGRRDAQRHLGSVDTPGVVRGLHLRG